jgi:hypothetical protein
VHRRWVLKAEVEFALAVEWLGVRLSGSRGEASAVARPSAGTPAAFPRSARLLSRSPATPRSPVSSRAGGPSRLARCPLAQVGPPAWPGVLSRRWALPPGPAAPLDCHRGCLAVRVDWVIPVKLVRRGGREVARSGPPGFSIAACLMGGVVGLDHRFSPDGGVGGPGRQGLGLVARGLTVRVPDLDPA